MVGSGNVDYETGYCPSLDASHSSNAIVFTYEAFRPSLEACVAVSINTASAGCTSLKVRVRVCGGMLIHKQEMMHFLQRETVQVDQ